MCGIAGAIDRVHAGELGGIVKAMVGRLEHRGPDDRGCADLGPIALGQSRLSILDTSSGGHQPMSSADGRYWIVHNGEIYNFLELADELRALGHQFRSETDTEVILAAYSLWGLECLRRFNGIWAMALWDTREETLVLSRDRFGVKPLYVAWRDGRLGFASEIKALRELPGMTMVPVAAAIRDFLVEGVVDHSDQTFFQGIERIPAGQSLVVTPRGSRLVRYWGPPELAQDFSLKGDAKADAHLVEELRSLFVDSVALELRSDVPLGTCLSGGMDSSSIVTVAAGLRNGSLRPVSASHRSRDAFAQKAFFAEFREPGLDERHHVDRVVSRTGVELHTVTPTFDDFLESLPEVVEHQDEPFASSSVVVQYHVMQLAKSQGVTVLLDGQGADEIFGGYPPFAGPRYAGLLRSGNLGALVRPLRARQVDLRALARYGIFGAHRLPGWLTRAREPSWLGDTARHGGSLWPTVATLDGTLLAQTLWGQVAGGGLSALLRYEDRNSMAFGIEARVPFLDHRVVELGLRLPDRLKVSNGRRKVALAKAMRGIVPDPILDRSDKIAFAPPQQRWLLEGSARWRQFMMAPRCEAEGYLRRGTAERALSGLSRGRVDHGQFWRILNLEMWLRAHV